MGAGVAVAAAVAAAGRESDGNKRQQGRRRLARGGGVTRKGRMDARVPFLSHSLQTADPDSRHSLLDCLLILVSSSYSCRHVPSGSLGRWPGESFLPLPTCMLSRASLQQRNVSNNENQRPVAKPAAAAGAVAATKPRQALAQATNTFRQLNLRAAAGKQKVEGDLKADTKLKVSDSQGKMRRLICSSATASAATQPEPRQR